MDHLTAPLEVLRARAVEWLADAGPRLLRVELDAELLEGARALIAALGWAPDNARAMFELEGIGAWGARAGELRAQHEAQVAGFAREGIALPALPPAPVGAGPLGAFAAALAGAARAFDNREIGTRGIVVVIVTGGERGPDAPQAQAQAEGELRELFGATGLERVRWIWLDAAPQERPGRALAGADACELSVRIDRAAQRRETDALVASLIAGVESGPMAVPGGARPRALPPPHPSDPPGRVPGDPPTAGGPGGHAPHLLPFLRAVQALRGAGAEAALPLLREARDAAAAAGLGVEAAEMEIFLGAFAIHAALARGCSVRDLTPVFESAAGRAEAAGAPGVCARARFFLGVSAAAAGETALARPSLLAAAEQARRAGDPALEGQARRLAAELAGDGPRARAAGAR